MGLPRPPQTSSQRQEIEDRLRARLSILRLQVETLVHDAPRATEPPRAPATKRSGLHLAALLVLCPCPIDHATGNLLRAESFPNDQPVPRGRTLLWLSFVLVLSFVGAGVELWGGHVAESKAVLVDGWHMAMHVFAISVSFALLFWREAGKRVQTLVTAFNVILLAVAGLFTLGEATRHLLTHVEVNFRIGFLTGLVGLIVNAACAEVFRSRFDLSRPLLRSAYLHVLADVVTSVLALVAVLASPWPFLRFLDPLLGVLGGLVICLWAVTLARQLRRVDAG